jgi:gas vesicle protein
MSDNNNELGAFLAGFIFGGLVGAAVALLTAPQSGEETRKYISDKGIELKNTAVEKAELARVKAEAAAAEAQRYAEEVKQKSQNIYVEQKSKVEKVIQRKPKELPVEPPAVDTPPAVG